MTDNGTYGSTLSINGNDYSYTNIQSFAKQEGAPIERLPYSLRILLEGCLRNAGKNGFVVDHARSILHWQPVVEETRKAVPFLPARVLLQDFTGLPVLNDLTALRAAVARKGKNAQTVNPRIPTDLVIDHSLQVAEHGCEAARSINEALEFKQNYERYQFLKWSQANYDNLQVLPPGLGICHQVNLEYLGKVAFVKETIGGSEIYPDTVMGTDSHTTMINGLGIPGWGVGGIEALSAMLEYPSEFPIPDVIGVHLTGELPAEATPTDLTLLLTAKLRELGVVGKFVEVFGASAADLPVETRAMVANMSPESGATMTYFPVDVQTIEFMRRSGRSDAHCALTEAYFKTQGLFRENDGRSIGYTQVLEFDLGEVAATLSGPKRPHDTLPLSSAKTAFQTALSSEKGLHGYGLNGNQLDDSAETVVNGNTFTLTHGSVLIAAITSCTNTSHPYVMLAAGLLARNAAEKGLTSKPWVKTSFAPGSRVVNAYLERAGLTEGLNALGFQTVGYGCTSCIGNSGPLHPEIEKVVTENGLVCAGVVSGNRNFEGRIHPVTRANYLASPPLVVAYALAGRMDIDFANEPLGEDHDGNPVYLKDIYPDQDEISMLAKSSITRDMFAQNYAGIYESSERWNALPVPAGEIYPWEADSTVIREPAFLFDGFNGGALDDILNAHALGVFGDSITTDHISPAGQIGLNSPAADYLRAHGVGESEFISYGARRGNHEVMARGTFSNPRLRNSLAGGRDGGYTSYLPDEEVKDIYTAAQAYIKNDIPLVVLAGKAYGTGSSRDWAAKGTYLLGIEAVIAESFERIHRTNLVCMGILPLEFMPGDSRESLGLTGKETYTIPGIDNLNELGGTLNIQVVNAAGEERAFTVKVRIDTPLDLIYFKAGGLMRRLLAEF